MSFSGPISLNTRWKITTTKASFDKLKKEQWFAGLVTLSRALNALRFVQMPVLDYQDEDSPAARRARFNSLLFSSALFVECVDLVGKLNKHFGKLPEFQELKEVTDKNKIAQQIIKSNLRDLRNRMVFHFCIEETGKQIEQLDFDEPIFVSGMGVKNAQVHYDLADLSAFKTFSAAPSQNEETAIKEIDTIVKKVTDLLTEFGTKAENLVRTVLSQNGWQLQIIGGSSF